MHKKYSIEFSKLYRRLMELEIVIKQNLFNSISIVYEDRGYRLFSNFFLRTGIKEKYKGKKGELILQKIHISNLTPNQKLEKSINTLYLSDLLKILVDIKQFHSIKEITEHFYLNEPDDLNIVKIRKGELIKLRNCIAHYNIPDYSKHHLHYTKALIFFEVHLGCSIQRLHSLPKFDKKTSTKDILIALYTIEPELFKAGRNNKLPYDRDRLLLDMFDDIAVINGWSYKDLHSPWTILRQKYELMKSKK